MSIITTWLFEHPILSLLTSICSLIPITHAGRKAFKDGLIDGYYAGVEGKSFSDYVSNRRRATEKRDGLDRKSRRNYSEGIEDEDIELDNEAEHADDAEDFFTSETYTEYSVITCQECGIDLIVDHITDELQYCCPECDMKYIVTYCNGVLVVIFIKVNIVDNSVEMDNMTVEDAYKLFDADQDTEWDKIVLYRKQLIQQYHPDKVAKLGRKLRELAESEGKRINVAYDLIKRHKQEVN